MAEDGLLSIKGVSFVPPPKEVNMGINIHYAISSGLAVVTSQRIIFICIENPGSNGTKGVSPSPNPGEEGDGRKYWVDASFKHRCTFFTIDIKDMIHIRLTMQVKTYFFNT